AREASAAVWGLVLSVGGLFARSGGRRWGLRWGGGSGWLLVFGRTLPRKRFEVLQISWVLSSVWLRWSSCRRRGSGVRLLRGRKLPAGGGVFRASRVRVRVGLCVWRGGWGRRRGRRARRGWRFGVALGGVR